MSLILNIDTATEHAGVCLSLNGQVRALQETFEQKNHASFLQPAIQQVVKEAGYTLHQLDAIAVSAGPGSYTGLRVGLASAKGLCYALNKPLIMLNTLTIMASASIQAREKEGADTDGYLFCPMIDARRMEVFTATYTAGLEEVEAGTAKILDESSFIDVLNNKTVIFTGSGSIKAKNIIKHPNAVFAETSYSVGEMAVLSGEAYKTAKFSNLAYSTPFYLKEFYKPIKKN